VELVEEPEDQKGQIQEATGPRPLVAQAIGVVLAMGQLTAEQGREVLREVSQQTKIKQHHVAELIVEWARTGKLCADIRKDLEQQLAQCARPPQAGA